MARHVRSRGSDILAANAADVAAATVMVDRLMLNEERLEGLAKALEHRRTDPPVPGMIPGRKPG